ncbi:MAG: Rqc2 family fibronectin-binding protein [Senegalia sp. (in: firmicutes)]|uniref:Rqc2 family fibronectin-binding protein n=1 Tax=Senegalia sp. (in: firmicutes) TaxID=1924098 RepID=UPI003F96C759
MSLDGITIRALVYELQYALINGKINKVHQPENDELLLDIRNNGISKKLIISASSNNPRIHFTKDTKKNPMSPAMFCMLLRKHIQNGRILSIEQDGFERVIKILISSYNELGDLTEKELIIEIMGRHSNIILVNNEEEKIIDSIKRVTPDISSVRQILPGMKYTPAPSQNKISPIDLNESNFLSFIKDDKSSNQLYKSIYENFVGISPLIAKEICNNAEIYENLNTDELNEEDSKKLFSSFKEIIGFIMNRNSNPTIVYNEYKTSILAFSSINLNQFENVRKENFDSINEMLDTLYETKDRLDRIKQKSLSLKKNIKTKLDRDKNKLSKQKDELLKAKTREKYKIAGELITANIYRIEKGMKEIEVIDYYNDNKDLKITLNPNLTPSENAQKKFKRYNKLKSAFAEVSDQIKQTKAEIDYLENILLSIENASDLDDLEEIREELIEENYIKYKKRNKSKNKKKKKESKAMHFLSSEGYDIYVGKNNKQNDYLTLKFADKNDIWLHTKDIPGSHVIIRKNSNEIPEQTLYEAALLSAFNSKARMSSNVAVDYTEKRNVKKPNGAKPGMVIYENNNTLYVTPSEKEISKIKKAD